MEETYKIFTRKLAYELRLQGFKCLGKEPCLQNPKYDVYLFEKTPELEKAIFLYTSRRAH